MDQKTDKNLIKKLQDDANNKDEEIEKLEKLLLQIKEIIAKKNKTISLITEKNEVQNGTIAALKEKIEIQEKEKEFLELTLEKTGCSWKESKQLLGDLKKQAEDDLYTGIIKGDPKAISKFMTGENIHNIDARMKGLLSYIKTTQKARKDWAQISSITDLLPSLPHDLSQYSFIFDIHGVITKHSGGPVQYGKGDEAQPGVLGFIEKLLQRNAHIIFATAWEDAYEQEPKTAQYIADGLKAVFGDKSFLTKNLEEFKKEFKETGRQKGLGSSFTDKDLSGMSVRLRDDRFPHSASFDLFGHDVDCVQVPHQKLIYYRNKQLTPLFANNLASSLDTIVFFDDSSENIDIFYKGRNDLLNALKNKGKISKLDIEIYFIQ